MLYKSKDNQEELTQIPLVQQFVDLLYCFTVNRVYSTSVKTMSVSFGDFKPIEISQLIEYKDPLGLDVDTEIYFTINNSENIQINTEKSETNMKHDAISHYIKMASTLKATTLKVSTITINNNSDSNKEKDKDTSPTLQVKNPITHTLSSGNLAKKVSFKSFNNIQQSCKRSCTKSHEDKIPGTSLDQNLDSLISRSNSNECIEDFNTKTKEITKAMQELHFRTIDLRNKPSKGRVNNNCPIITQVTERNYLITATQVWMEIYPQHNLGGKKSGDYYIRR